MRQYQAVISISLKLNGICVGTSSLTSLDVAVALHTHGLRVAKRVTATVSALSEVLVSSIYGHTLLSMAIPDGDTCQRTKVLNGSSYVAS